MGGDDATALPRPVEVRHTDGQWYAGWLEGTYRDTDGRWHAMVRYHVAPGRQHYQWRDEADVRKVKELEQP